MDGLAGGLRTSIFGMFLYALGGYIKLYDPFVRVRSVSLLLGLLVIEIIEYISYYNITSQNIENYYKNGGGKEILSRVYRHLTISMSLLFWPA